MRILSDYHDYYDGLMAVDEDRELIYQRKVKEIPYKLGSWGEKGNFPFPLCRGVTTKYWQYPFYNEQYIVGFCGVIYPFLTMRVKLRGASVSCRTIEDLDIFIEANFSEEEVAGYRSKKIRRKWHGFHRSVYKDFFDECESKKGAYGHIFEEHRSPIFMAQADAGRAILVVNAPLGDFGFAKIVEPYQAYQEIRMFLGNMAAPEKPIPQVDDETMAEIKGHGGKYSFRKPPKK